MAAYKIEIDREVDGRWIAEIPAIAGVMAYGTSQKEAIAKVESLAYRVLADRIEREKEPSKESAVSFTCA